MDLDTQIDLDYIYKVFPNHEIMKTSLLREDGIHDVEEAIVKRVYDGSVLQDGDHLLSNVRHIQSVKDALSSIKSAIKAVKDQMPYDFIEVDTLDCLESLGKITGETIESDIVKEIFGSFCLGK